MPEQIEYDITYLNVAIVIAQLSKDPKRKVGAVITKDNKIVSTGYNGFPRHIDESGKWEPNKKHDYVIHAELNAILNSTIDLKDSTVYCTYQPCINCLKHAINAGIKKIIFLEKQKILKDELVWHELASNFIEIRHQPFRR